MTTGAELSTSTVNGEKVVVDHSWIMKAAPNPTDSAGQRAIEKAMAAARAKVAARKEAEAARFREKMAEPVATEVPKQVRVRAGDVHFDRHYQTDDRYDDGRAKRIAERFDWEQLDPIKINIRPNDPSGTAWCYDGRHRTNAVLMRLGPDTPMNATLIRVPYEREADLFAEQDGLKKKVPKSIKFRAKIEAGDADALAQQALLDRLGLTIGSHADTRTISLTAFLDCCTIKGMAATEEALAFVLDAWHGARESLEAPIAKGIVWFVANRRDDPAYRSSRVRDVLARATVREIEKAAGSKPDRMTAQQRIAAVIVDLYNRAMKDRFAIAEWNPRKDR